MRCLGTSRSTWACELKWAFVYNGSEPYGHAPRERVSWNDKYVICGYRIPQSRSTWACELKLPFFTRSNVTRSSRSTWACELKSEEMQRAESVSSHAPRERVSWNDSDDFIERIEVVTLHVSVWVEIITLFTSSRANIVTLHVSVWVEIIILDFC